MTSKPRVIAFYLPQFHPIPENDDWWGKGFTEWTNVAKAKPLFLGHKQPKIPTDLGFYDLRVPEVREAQAQLAKDSGIEGFCYWHYWFGNGKQLLERPFREVVESGKPNFPFCLGWANEDWKSKTWGAKKGKDITLINQTYPGKQDIIDHFYSLLKAFCDKRYITVDDMPLFLIYKPNFLPDTRLFIEIWKKLAHANGLKGIYFVAHAQRDFHRISRTYLDSLLNEGYDAVYTNRLENAFNYENRRFFSHIKYIFCNVLKIPHQFNFDKNLYKIISNEDRQQNYFPGILSGWDHTPRSGRRGHIIVNFNEKNWAEHVKSVCDIVKEKLNEYQIVFLKSWNEWGEGNYLEPDHHSGNMKLDVLRKILLS
jgi:lipopolysaccharide biosynthesis protein